MSIEQKEQYRPDDIQANEVEKLADISNKLEAAALAIDDYLEYTTSKGNHRRAHKLAKWIKKIFNMVGHVNVISHTIRNEVNSKDEE